MENKIEIHNMNLHYGDFHALHDINLDIKENEITAFIGPSGCGKSTLLRSLNRMNDLVENCRITGDIMLDGCLLYTSHLEYLGIKIDPEKNKYRGKQMDISIDWARVRVLVIPTNEELMIAKDTERLVNEAKAQ